MGLLKNHEENNEGLHSPPPSCPGAPDPDACEAGLPVQWPIIGAVLFPEFLKGDAICGDTGVCREITCEDCQAGIEYITGLMRMKNSLAMAVAFLQGDAYCGNAPDPANCGDLVAQLIPIAMDVLASAFTETQVEICQDVNGVC